MLQQHQHEAGDASTNCSVTHLGRPPGVALCLGPDDTPSIRLGLDLLSSGSPCACLGADLHMYRSAVWSRQSAGLLLSQTCQHSACYGRLHAPAAFLVLSTVPERTRCSVYLADKWSWSAPYLALQCGALRCGLNGSLLSQLRLISIRHVLILGIVDRMRLLSMLGQTVICMLLSWHSWSSCGQLVAQAGQGRALKLRHDVVQRANGWR